MKLTAAIISKNSVIPKIVLDSVKFSDEIIIVVDTPIKKKPIKKGRIVTYFHPLNNDFSNQRNFALSQASHDWVLFIDDDEYVSTELALEIQKATSSRKYSGLYIPRLDVCFHQQLLHGETGHIRLLRLAQKKAGKYVRPVHEYWQVKGKVGQLSAPLYHIKDYFISDFIDRMAQYSAIDADVLSAENKPYAFWRLILNPEAKFFVNYYGKLGFLDGTVGLFQAYLMSVQSLTVRVFQWTKRN